jgi:transcriptional regulator with XRE-family HTH domain
MASLESRLNEMMAKKKHSPESLAKLTKIHANSIRQYASGKVSPTADKIDAICTALNCSSDYLLGRVDDAEFSPLARECAAIITRLEDFEQQFQFVQLTGFVMLRSTLNISAKARDYARKLEQSRKASTS